MITAVLRVSTGSSPETRQHNQRSPRVSLSAGRMSSHAATIAHPLLFERKRRSVDLCTLDQVGRLQEIATRPLELCFQCDTYLRACDIPSHRTLAIRVIVGRQSAVECH